MFFNTVFVGLSVNELATTRDWFDRFFGRPADVVVSDVEVMWQMTDGARLYVVQDAPPRTFATVVLAVDDLDDALAVLAGRGLEPGELEVVASAGRKAYFTDPNGNEVVLAEIYEP
ncbi:MAG: VOC family protein [Acidimicrobiales bacterium]